MSAFSSNITIKSINGSTVSLVIQQRKCQWLTIILTLCTIKIYLIGGFSAQKASNAVNILVEFHHHDNNRLAYVSIK